MAAVVWNVWFIYLERVQQWYGITENYYSHSINKIIATKILLKLWKIQK